VRISTPFAGGVGGSEQEMCGVLSGGILLLGALWGRTSSQEDDSLVYRLASRFRDRFIALAGSSQCRAIRERLPERPKRCQPIVSGGIRTLVELIEATLAQGLLPTQTNAKEQTR